MRQVRRLGGGSTGHTGWNQDAKRREWIRSSIKETGQPCFTARRGGYPSIEEKSVLKTIAGETESHLYQIKESAFGRSELKSIVIPSSMPELCEYYLSSCPHMRSVTCEVNWTLKTISKSALSALRLTDLGIPWSPATHYMVGWS